MFFYVIILLTSNYLRWLWADEHMGNHAHKDHHEHDHKENHDDSENKIHLEGFDKDAENLIQRVKHAIANEEGCLVSDFPLLSSSGSLI